MITFQSPAGQFDAVIASVHGLTQKDIVATAKRMHLDVMRTPPKPVSFKRHVDGREAPEEAVKVGGVIVYDYNRLDIVAKLALEVLRDLSPVKSGEYVAGHRIILDTPEEIRIANTVEYSRVIEVGSRGSVKLKINKGGHVYERAARRLRGHPEVANSVKIQFTFTEATGGGAAGRDRHAKRASQWPTLILTAL